MLAAIPELDLLDPWLLVLLPIAVVAYGWRLRRARAALPAAALVLFDAVPGTARSRLVRLPGALTVLGVALLIVALARPVTREVLPIRELGVDILLLVDVSTSMDETDTEGEKRRVEVARDAAVEFANGRENDRIGFMSFARYPELRCPLTLDMRALGAFLRTADTVKTREEDGTAIGHALGQAVRFLEQSNAGSKVVVLLTDGENTVPGLPPAEAAKLASDAGVRVHTIGFGGGTIVRSPFGDVHRIPTDFRAIREVAQITGGRFFEARDGEALAGVYAEIDTLEKVELEDPRYRTSDWFAWPLLVGVGLCALALLLEVAWIRGVP